MCAETMCGEFVQISMLPAEIGNSQPSLKNGENSARARATAAGRQFRYAKHRTPSAALQIDDQQFSPRSFAASSVVTLGRCRPAVDS